MVAVADEDFKAPERKTALHGIVDGQRADIAEGGAEARGRVRGSGSSEVKGGAAFVGVPLERAGAVAGPEVIVAFRHGTGGDLHGGMPDGGTEHGETAGQVEV